MKFRVTAATAMALAIAATTASAGVVISQDLLRKDQSGQRKIKQTLMLQGHKEKIISGDRETIIDLDAGKMALVTRSAKTFVQTSFPPPVSYEFLLAHEGMSVGFKKGPGTHKIKGYACQDYYGSASAFHVKIDVSECVASGAPSAKEFTEFQTLLTQKLKGTRLASTGEIPDGIPVSSIIKVTSVAFAATGGVPPATMAKLQADLDKRPTITQMNLSKIEVKDLPLSEFVVPADFLKREPPRTQMGVGPKATKPPPPATLPPH